MIVSDFSTRDYINLSPNSTIREAISGFLNHRVDICCITLNNKLIGIVHKYSIYRALLDNFPMDYSLKSFINENVVTIFKNQDLLEAREIMIEGNVSQAVVLDDNNNVYGIMTKSDIVHSNMTYLEDTLHRMKSLIEHLQDAVISIDKNFTITSFNQALLNLLKINNTGLTGANIELIFPSFKKWIEDTFKSGKPQLSKRIDFKRLTVIASFIPIRELDQMHEVLIVFRDITSYESIADELETTNNIRKLLDSALDLSYDGVLITDNNGYITMTNKGIRDLLNLKDSQKVVGHSISEIVPEINYKQSLIFDKKIEGELIEINNRKCIVAQMPIYQNGQKLGAIYKIIFKQLETWKEMLIHMDKLESQITYYRDELNRISKGSHHFDHIISINEGMEKLKRESIISAKSLSNVLITGESGTGKELLAEGIHKTSERKGKFIKVNCSAIPEELLESEFFGYADGAFTGAKKGGKPGKFELANNGTLFLDEIGEMPLALQAKLLRVLQEQEFERVGATTTTKVNVRIISATNKDLLELVKEGKFREDLYYRIDVIQLRIPQLKERLDDIPILCRHFIEELNKKANTEKNITGVSPEVIKVFQNYHWPGNVRQLQNILERAYYFSNSAWIDMEHLPNELLNKEEEDILRKSHTIKSKPKPDLNRENVIHNADKQAIIEALIKSKGNRTKAAENLGISRTTLYNKIKKYDIQEEINFVLKSS
ncbi:sigma 54-interacting transcriptional regulator [Oceanobacillus salinisoli]|uniref:sigma 54-interacting transcriptional regulator n=1 Tax=Oceanobacillus salinisoli TaxID=2678611 RepID=UPI0012E1FDFF|nr:sigma 54-interacting transcriptional regulator [Oceanobacillus salinisoli]